MIKMELTLNRQWDMGSRMKNWIGITCLFDKFPKSHFPFILLSFDIFDVGT